MRNAVVAFLVGLVIVAGTIPFVITPVANHHMIFYHQLTPAKIIIATISVTHQGARTASIANKINAIILLLPARSRR